EGNATNNAAAEPSTITVEKISPVESAAPVERQAAVTGTRQALFLLLKYKGDTQEPHPINFYAAQLTNPMSPVSGSKTPATINQFFNAVSWGKLKFNATVGGNKWFTLPGNKAHYAPCNNFGSGCTSANINLIAQDAMKLATAAKIDVTKY